MLRAQLHSFDIICQFQRFLSTQVLWAHILLCYTTDNTMQRDDFVSCRKIATGFFFLISSPAPGGETYFTGSPQLGSPRAFEVSMGLISPDI